jgi:NADPH:quinone reductase-like Zn-dependent oxidoreductase
MMPSLHLLPEKLFVLASALTLVVSASHEDAPATMKAVRFHAFGDPGVLRVEDVPKPSAQPGEILVRVHAAGVNPVDWKIRSGAARGLNPTLPQIPGFDVSGVVDAIGPEVTSFAVGDEVFAYLSLKRGGAYAEYVTVPASDAAQKPKKVDHVHAAAVPLAALTAWQALFDTAGLKAGDTVLVHGGAGGVGHFAVQLAKHKGAKVIATASEKNHAFLRELGADVLIDYRTQKFEEIAKDVDVVLDTVGDDTLERSYAVLKKGGFVVSIVEPPKKETLAERGVRGAVILVKPDGKELAEIAALIDSGKVRPEVSEIVPLAEAKRAHELSQGGHTRGKIVLKIAE